MKKSGSRSVALLCALIMVLASLLSVTTVSADEVADKRQELNQLKQEQQKLENEISSLGDSVEDQQKKVNGLWAQVTNLGEQIDGYRSKIKALDKQIKEQEEQIRQLDEDIKAKEKELEGIIAKLKKRLHAMEKTGNYSSLQLLFSTSSYEDYLLKNKIVQSIAKHDQGLIDTAEQEKAAIEKDRKELEEKKKKTEDEKKEQEESKSKLDAQYNEYDDTYTKAKNAQIALEKQLGTYEKKLAQVKKAEEELDREIEQLLNAVPATSTYGGKMYWPAPGMNIISSPFGNRNGGFHGGTDIWGYGCLGKPIVASADGTVIKAQSMHYSYGNFVMIDHGLDASGRRIVTLYAHMRYAPSVSVGQAVKGGKTQLGVIGNTGESYGAHLHFEVRVNNTRVNAVSNGYIARPR